MDIGVYMATLDQNDYVSNLWLPLILSGTATFDPILRHKQPVTYKTTQTIEMKFDYFFYLTY